MTTRRRVGIATDHGGFLLKQELLAQLNGAGHEVVDFGAFLLDPEDDYPDFVIPFAKAVAAGSVDRGVAICGSGVGASVCASKVPGARAALLSARIALEQASTFGWERYVGSDGRVIGMETFGASAPLKELQRKFGFEPDRVVLFAKEMLGRW